MTAIVLEDIHALLDLQAEDPEERYMLSGVSWQQYEELLEKLGDSPWYRVTYWEGVLEIMAPSRKHDRSKTDIGMLLEAYFQEARIRFWGLGSTTFRQQKQQSGTEPDECYCLGSEKEFPDLAVEVVVTSGSIDKLEVYRRLNVLEVWFWKQGKFVVHCLRSDGYEQIDQSELLPDLDLELLGSYVQHPDPLEAVLEFRERVREQIQQR